MSMLWDVLQISGWLRLLLLDEPPISEHSAQSISYFTPHHTRIHHTTSRHIMSHHTTSYHITSHHVILHHITLHHITSHYIISHHTTSHHLREPGYTFQRKFGPWIGGSIIGSLESHSELKISRQEWEEGAESSLWQTKCFWSPPLSGREELGVVWCSAVQCSGWWILWWSTPLYTHLHLYLHLHLYVYVCKKNGQFTWRTVQHIVCAVHGLSPLSNQCSSLTESNQIDVESASPRSMLHQL
jgi:Actin